MRWGASFVGWTRPRRQIARHDSSRPRKRRSERRDRRGPRALDQVLQQLYHFQVAAHLTSLRGGHGYGSSRGRAACWVAYRGRPVIGINKKRVVRWSQACTTASRSLVLKFAPGIASPPAGYSPPLIWRSYLTCPVGLRVLTGLRPQNGGGAAQKTNPPGGLWLAGLPVGGFLLPVGRIAVPAESAMMTMFRSLERVLMLMVVRATHRPV